MMVISFHFPCITLICIKISQMKTYFETDSPDRKEYSKLIKNNSVELNYNNLDALIDRIGDAKCVLLGEASHGTHEYYTWRTQISKKLIEKKGFSFIAVEGDWPDC